MTDHNTNVLLILTDQHLASTIGQYGSVICQTPNIDALARDGVTFDNAYTSCPICTPARASIQTGLYPFRHGMQSNIYTRGCMIHELPDNPNLLSRRLQALGYQTGYTGKWHMGIGQDREQNPEYQNHLAAVPALGHYPLKGCLPSDVGYEGDDFPGHGGCGDGYAQYHQYLADHGIELRTKTIVNHYPKTFEVLSGKQSTVSHFLADSAMQTLARFAGRERPWFYMLNFWGPHEPYHAATEHVDLYRNVQMPEWASFKESQRHKPRIHNAHRTAELVNWDWQQFQTLLRYCYAAVTAIDEEIGRLIAYLKQRGEYDSTTIIFAADHGDSIGAHRGLTDKSVFMYEETNRIPLIIKAPGAKAGTREQRFAGTCDLYSTVLDYAGLDARAAQRDGQSLRPLVEGRAVTWRDCIVTEASGIDFLLHSQRMIRFDRYKYVFNAGGIDELYDLQADPHELANLAESDEHAELLREMREKLAAWMEAHGDGLLERYLRLWKTAVTD